MSRRTIAADFSTSQSPVDDALSEVFPPGVLEILEALGDDWLEMPLSRGAARVVGDVLEPLTLPGFRVKSDR